MNLEQLVSETLCLPPMAISYHISQNLANLFPGKAILETTDCDFNVESFSENQLCTIEVKKLMHNQISSYWANAANRREERILHAWLEIKWQGYSIDVLNMTWDSDSYYWIVTEVREIAENFFRAVCEWNNEVRFDKEALVFDGGHWYKDEELIKAIKSATFDNLILPGEFINELRNDLVQFFNSKAHYDKYKVPWKRGILLVGPPGNGKTHAIKALINTLGQPCLYVKSFKSYGGDEQSIRSIFMRARAVAPCVLILEDLDSQITSHNRSFFLNELDGFTNNSGILTLATTNHPDKLDPAIVERPSRFDRKYHFTLPALPERLAYIAMWNKTLESEMQLTENGVKKVAELTENFSFAYLKELFVSATMRWISNKEPVTMDKVIAGQAQVLRTQMGNVTATTVKKKKKKAKKED